MEEEVQEEDGPGILGMIVKILPYAAFLIIGMVIYGIMNRFIGRK